MYKTYFELNFHTADRNGANDISLESYGKCATFVSLQVFSNSVQFSSNFENTIFWIYSKTTDSNLSRAFQPFVGIMQVIWHWKAME
jgi:hypothetical protein